LHVVVPTERNVTIINQTTNVTNITYSNSVIVDRGPSYDDLRARSSQPIERFRLERTQDVNNERPVFRGEVVAVPTLDFRPAERAARPTRVVRTITQPVVESGWAGIQDAQAAKKARAKMKAEATPPPNLPPKRFVRPEATVIPPSSAPVNVGQRGAGAPPVPAASSAPGASPAAEPTQPSPAENIVSPKQADRNRREAEKAERQHNRQGRRRGIPNETPTATAAPPPAATAAPSATPPVAASPAPIATPAPAAPTARDRSGGRQMQEEARRAQRTEQRRGRNSRETVPTPAETQTPAPAVTPSSSPADAQANSVQGSEDRRIRGKRADKRRANAAGATPGTESATPSPAETP
jgi:hypothetical protein